MLILRIFLLLQGLFAGCGGSEDSGTGAAGAACGATSGEGGATSTTTSSTGGGGGQFNGGLRITNSTFANNSAPAGSGGGIQSNGTLGAVLTNDTFSGNSALNNGGGIHRGTTSATFFIRNSIIAGNTGAATSLDVSNSAAGLISEGNNIIGSVGTSTGWIMSDQQNVNPMLGTLGNNGGFGTGCS